MQLLIIIIVVVIIPEVLASAVSYPQEALPTKSGYLTVNTTSGSSIFYTFYEAQNKPNINTPISQTPILIWLEGGPGCASMTANYFQIGPYLVTPNLTLHPNPGSWNNIFGLLFLDNPIGTGFSIASSPHEIPRNQDDVAEHLYIAIKKFIALDDMFKNRPIYITGESYAGKYIPALGCYILEMNKEGDYKVNLAGVAIGNALVDPGIQVATYGVHSYNLGLINEKQESLLEDLQEKAVEFVNSGNWSEATAARTKLLNTLSNMTGLATLLDFRRLIPYQDSVVDRFLNRVEIKRALGAKESIVFEGCSDTVADALNDDVMKSVRNKVEYLVKESRVLLYQGQCDLLDGVVSNLAWIKKMKWDGIDEFLAAERKVWKVDGKLAGHVQKWGSLSNVVVMNAGHLVPADQLVNSQDMIEDWVLNRDLFGGGVENADMPRRFMDSIGSIGCQCGDESYTNC